MSQYQIAWRWRSEHAPAGSPIRWTFVAHGAAYERKEAALTAALLRGQGKMVRLLPLPTGKEKQA